MVIDYYLERHCIRIAERPQRKGEDTLTHFNRDIFWYNRDNIKRQTSITVVQATEVLWVK